MVKNCVIGVQQSRQFYNMEPVWLFQQMCKGTTGSKGVPGNPYPLRPWLQDRAAAAPASTNVGVKGIIAGNYINYK